MCLCVNSNKSRKSSSKKPREIIIIKLKRQHVDAWMGECIKLHSRKLILEYLTHHSSRVEFFVKREGQRQKRNEKFLYGHTTCVRYIMCVSRRASNVSEFKIPSHYYSFILSHAASVSQHYHHHHHCHHHVTLHYSFFGHFFRLFFSLNICILSQHHPKKDISHVRCACSMEYDCIIYPQTFLEALPYFYIKRWGCDSQLHYFHLVLVVQFR